MCIGRQRERDLPDAKEARVSLYTVKRKTQALGRTAMVRKLLLVLHLPDECLV